MSPDFLPIDFEALLGAWLSASGEAQRLRVVGGMFGDPGAAREAVLALLALVGAGPAYGLESAARAQEAVLEGELLALAEALAVHLGDAGLQARCALAQARRARPDSEARYQALRRAWEAGRLGLGEEERAGLAWECLPVALASTTSPWAEDLVLALWAMPQARSGLGERLHHALASAVEGVAQPVLLAWREGATRASCRQGTGWAALHAASQSLRAGRTAHALVSLDAAVAVLAEAGDDVGLATALVSRLTASLAEQDAVEAERAAARLARLAATTQDPRAAALLASPPPTGPWSI